jgi:hypothetical protein
MATKYKLNPRQFGRKGPPRISAQVVAEICAMYQDGAALSQITLATGKAETTIYKVLHRAGIEPNRERPWAAGRPRSTK